MRRPFTIITALTMAALLATTACTGKKDDDNGDGELPNPDELLSASADEMGQVETVRLQLATDTALAGLPVTHADAVVTREGEAEGTAELDLGAVVAADFVMVGDTFHYRAIGPWQQLPRAAAPYDASAILDPDRGVANLLRNANEPRIQGRETVSGVDTYQVTARFAAVDLVDVLPGVTEDIDGTLWIGVDRPLLHRAAFEIPGGTVTTNLSEFDAPVEISEP
jgi:lipoprotein LprG